MTKYGKKEAKKTKGMAILCMVMLHLFCRKGNDVLGTPLVWLNETTPAIYWLGFFSEICVPIYSICAGYAQQLEYEKGNCTWKNNFKRIRKLLVTYWIVLSLFSVIGLICDPNGSIPGNFISFIKAIFLLHSYNGAWWYLNTYMLLLILSPVIMRIFVKKINSKNGILIGLGIQVMWYLINRLRMWPSELCYGFIFDFLFNEVTNFISVIPYFVIGAFLCKDKVVDKVNEYFKQNKLDNKKNIVLFTVLIITFFVMNLLHKAVLVSIVALIAFFVFNLIDMPDYIEKIFLFLGEHSTNIWLVHMFFYAYVFKDFVTIVKYPLFMLLFMILLCVITSYIIKLIEKVIYSMNLRGAYEN